jgi:hypothetical protein
MVSVMYIMIRKFLLEGKRSKKANWQNKVVKYTYLLD